MTKKKKEKKEYGKDLKNRGLLIFADPIKLAPIDKMRRKNGFRLLIPLKPLIRKRLEKMGIALRDKQDLPELGYKFKKHVLDKKPYVKDQDKFFEFSVVSNIRNAKDADEVFEVLKDAGIKVTRPKGTKTNVPFAQLEGEAKKEAEKQIEQKTSMSDADKQKAIFDKLNRGNFNLADEAVEGASSIVKKVIEWFKNLKRKKDNGKNLTDEELEIVNDEEFEKSQKQTSKTGTILGLGALGALGYFLLK